MRRQQTCRLRDVGYQRHASNRNSVINPVSEVHASITFVVFYSSPSGMARLTDPKCIQIFARAVHTNELVVMVVPQPEHLLDPYWLCSTKGSN